MRKSADDDGVMNRLLRRKNDLRTQLDLAAADRETVTYNGSLARSYMNVGRNTGLVD